MQFSSSTSSSTASLSAERKQLWTLDTGAAFGECAAQGQRKEPSPLGQEHCASLAWGAAV
jgi:hypothetical protein